MALPELVFISPVGGTINKYELSGGKRLFLRFISCYSGNCRFYESIEDAANHLDLAQSQSIN